MNKQQRAIAATLEYLREADIVLTEEEQQRIEIATFGLADYPVSGLQLLTYVNSPRYCAKELVLFPGQPEVQIIMRQQHGVQFCPERRMVCLEPKDF